MPFSPLSLKSLNPSDGSLVWEGPVAGEAEINTAVTAARQAFPEWAALPLEERATLLTRFARQLESRATQLATLIAREVGKPLPEALAEVSAMAGKVAISRKAWDQRCSTFQGGGSVTRFKPHGVVAVLGPYNFPGHLPNGHIVPALLAGNTVVFKPSEHAPATAEATGDCWQATGLPPGVLHILQGGAETAKALTAHPELDGLFFTGSAAIGKLLARQFAETPGRILALEMGGNNPLIIDTANLPDLATAVDITVKSAFLSAGQRCTCARRLVVIESSATEAFLSALCEAAAGLSMGDPLSDPPPFMGPLASPAFADAAARAQEDRLAAGALSLLKARRGASETGFISPAILDVTPVRNLPDEEVFGPLLQVIRVRDLKEAISIANQTRYGLAAGVLTTDEAAYRSAWQRLRAGIINWNTQLTGASSAAPFGGTGDSGNLRPSAFFAADYCAYPVASMEKAAP